MILNLTSLNCSLRQLWLGSRNKESLRKLWDSQCSHPTSKFAHLLWFYAHCRPQRSACNLPLTSMMPPHLLFPTSTSWGIVRLGNCTSHWPSIHQGPGFWPSLPGMSIKTLELPSLLHPVLRPERQHQTRLPCLIGVKLSDKRDWNTESLALDWYRKQATSGKSPGIKDLE